MDAWMVAHLDASMVASTASSRAERMGSYWAGLLGVEKAGLKVDLKVVNLATHLEMLDLTWVDK